MADEKKQEFISLLRIYFDAIAKLAVIDCKNEKEIKEIRKPIEESIKKSPKLALVIAPKIDTYGIFISKERIEDFKKYVDEKLKDKDIDKSVDYSAFLSSMAKAIKTMPANNMVLKRLIKAVLDEIKKESIRAGLIQSINNFCKRKR